MGKGTCDVEVDELARARIGFNLCGEIHHPIVGGASREFFGVLSGTPFDKNRLAGTDHLLANPIRILLDQGLDYL
jgi:hypothetical protein